MSISIAMPARRRRSHSGGFTLIEMLIAITVGMAILAGLVGVLASSSGSARTNDRSAELMTNGRYAFNSVRTEIRQAGFKGFTWEAPLTTAQPWTAVASGCAGTEAGASPSAFVTNIRQSIWGANNGNPFEANCLPAANYAAGNDVLVVRRLASQPTTTLRANEVYFRSNYERGQVFRGTTGPVFSSPSFPPMDFAVQIFVYYICPFTTSATETPRVPSLRRLYLRNDGLMVDELVASGIERMQVQYGHTNTALVTRYYNVFDGNSSQTDNSMWDEVDAVRISLLARSTTVEPGYVNNTSYEMGDQPAYVPNDGFRRQLFEAVVQLRNP